jgi:sulfur-carrier protein
MSVRLRYFAWVRERVGKPEEVVETPPGIQTVGELMAWLTYLGVPPIRSALVLAT